MFFICEMEDSHMKINSIYDIFILRMELKHFNTLNPIFICEMASQIFVRHHLALINGC